MSSNKQKKYKSVLLCRRKPTQEEREKFEENFNKEREKYERDLKCGGVSDDGYYVRLHDRH